MKNSLRQFCVLILRNGYKKADYLRKHGGFHAFGENVLYQTNIIPSEPYLVSIGNNVALTAGVRLITHDVIQTMFRDSRLYPVCDNLFYMGKIDIKDNVMIGANSVIMYDVTIGPNAIISAGSVVVKDVEPGMIVGGNPAKVIGTVEELANKRLVLMPNRPNDKYSMEIINEYFWNSTNR